MGSFSALSQCPSQRSRELQASIDLFASAAPTTVLITGETGAGKAAVARTLHARSGRHAEPFFTYSPKGKTQLEIEIALFGGVERGLLAEASSGVLLIADAETLPLSIQDRLFDFHQQREFQPRSGAEPVTSNAWVLYATTITPAALVREKLFRASFYQAVSVLRLEVPPLRERSEDIPVLFSDLAEQIAPGLRRTLDLPQAFWDSLLQYDWPGNVGELRERLEHCFEEMRGASAAEFQRCMLEKADQLSEG